MRVLGVQATMAMFKWGYTSEWRMSYAHVKFEPGLAVVAYCWLAIHLKAFFGFLIG